MKSGKAGRKRGRPEISYLLNEPQLDYLLRIIRGRDPERVNQFKLDVTKAFTDRRATQPVRREYLPGYHESRDGLKALGRSDITTSIWRVLKTRCWPVRW